MQGRNDRLKKYERMGCVYEEKRYSSPFRRHCLALRNQTLLNLAKREVRERERIEILEVRCGTGLSLDFLSRSSDRLFLHGVDISATMLDQAKSKFIGREMRPKLKQGSAFNLPYQDTSFDALYCTRFIHQFKLEEQARIYREFYRVVRPRGLVIVEFYGARHGQTKMTDARLAEKYPDQAEVAKVVRSRYRRVILSFRGGQFLPSRFGTWPIHPILKELRLLPIRLLFSEYFAISRSPV